MPSRAEQDRPVRDAARLEAASGHGVLHDGAGHQQDGDHGEDQPGRARRLLGRPHQDRAEDEDRTREDRDDDADQPHQDDQADEQLGEVHAVTLSQQVRT
jgi:hypothetical protein